MLVDCEMMGSGYLVHAATRKIAQGCNILIVTAGKLLQKLLDENIVSFKDVEFLVLYESESLLDDQPNIIDHPSMPTKERRYTYIPVIRHLVLIHWTSSLQANPHVIQCYA